jgi:hypothetical protein
MIALLEARVAGLWSRKHIANNVLAVACKSTAY